MIPHKVLNIRCYICTYLALFFIFVFIRLLKYQILQFHASFLLTFKSSRSWKVTEDSIMSHNYEVGNIVKLKSNGQNMRIISVRKNPIDEELSDYIVCEWDMNGEKKQRTFHVDEVEFVNVGKIKPYNIDNYY